MSLAPENFKVLPINADRFCEGISKIGYLPSAAIMDIVDNAVAASASRIVIDLVLREGATTNQMGGIDRIRISDNGKGMTDDQIDTALQLGSDVDYPENSLSKFGFGLKSAGFSLGGRIQVVSKTAAAGPSQLKFVDREVIRAMKQYGVCTVDVDADTAGEIASVGSGTIIEISKPLPRQDSAGKIRKELQQKLGVTYFHHLIGEPGLEIIVKIRDQQYRVPPVDILFWDDAGSGFDPDNYDPRRPVRVCDEWVENPTEPSGPKIRVQMAIFPQNKMSGYLGYTEEERAKIRDYKVSGEYAGFFFYRNGRLIRWGDKIAGAGRDHQQFRAKVSFETVHDDLFHVDVSKQNLIIPEETEASLQLMARLPISQSKQAAEICATLLNAGAGGEGVAFNKRAETFQESDAAEDTNPAPPEEKRKRREKLAEPPPEVADVKDEPAAEATADAETMFQRVRYSDNIAGLSAAVPGWDTDNGTFVRVNKNHPFYQLVLANLPAADPNRVSIESILFAMAVGENKTRQNLADVDSDKIEKVFQRFRKVMSENLDLWVSENQDLYG